VRLRRLSPAGEAIANTTYEFLFTAANIWESSPKAGSCAEHL
jgi:hypothetical protein